MVDRDKVWIYKWNYSNPGEFYGIREDGSTVVGRVNLEVATDACNWVLVFVKTLGDAIKLPECLGVKRVERETDPDKVWWCATGSSTPDDFVRGQHHGRAIFVYFNHLRLHKCATFLLENKCFVGISNVACLHPDRKQLILSQYFLQRLRRNSDFSSTGLFSVRFASTKNEGRGENFVSDPFSDLEYVSSDLNLRPDFKVAAFDLEVAVTDGKGNFPNGLAEAEKIVGVSVCSATMKGSTGKRLESENARELWLLVPKGSKNSENESDFLSTNTSISVRVFDEERRMLVDFLLYLKRFHCVIGYNSDSFDNNVLIARCLRLAIPMMNASDERDSRYFVRDWLDRQDFQEVTFVYPHQDGVDVMKYLKRYYNGPPFPSYRLNDVARTILGSGKADMDVTRIHGEYTRMYRDGGARDPEFLSELCHYMEIDGHLPLDLFFSLQMYNLIFGISFLTLSNAQTTMGPISVPIVNALFYKTYFPQNKPFSYERNYARLVRRYRRDEKDARENDSAASSASRANLATAGYQGAHVVNPTPGRYRDVMVFDFASLYPSVIIRFHISADYVFSIRESEYLGRKDYYDEHFFAISIDGKTVLTPRNAQTPLSALEELLVKTRFGYKKLKGVSLFYSTMQEALKLLANAMYGQLGWLSFVSDFLAAATVTAYGRLMLDRCLSFFEENGFLTLYGDTDSVFVIRNPSSETAESASAPGPVDEALCAQLVERFHEYMNSDFPKLEFENIFTRLVLIHKKCYVGDKKGGGRKVTGFPKVLPPAMADFTSHVIDLVLRDDVDRSAFCRWLDAAIVGMANEAQDDDLNRFVQMTKFSKKTSEYPETCRQPHVVFARELEIRGVDLSTLGGQVYYVQAIKDVEATHVGLLYELLEEANKACLNVDLYYFAKRYVGVLSSLLDVSYNLEKSHLRNAFKDIGARLRAVRLTRLRAVKPFRQWIYGKVKLRSIPDVRDFYAEWYDFAARYKPESGKRNGGCGAKSVSLRWIPSSGFCYPNVDHPSEWQTLSLVERHFVRATRATPRFQLTVLGPWTVTDFISDVLGLVRADDDGGGGGEEDSEDCDTHVTPYGVFESATKSVRDCLEKCLA